MSFSHILKCFYLDFPQPFKNALHPAGPDHRQVHSLFAHTCPCSLLSALLGVEHLASFAECTREMMLLNCGVGEDS